MSGRLTATTSTEGHCGTILIADDDPIALEVISTVLKNAGWGIKCAKNGRQVLDTIDAMDVDGLILDMRMPVLDGYEVCLRLLRRGKKIPTLVVTGHIGDSEPLGYLNVTRTVLKPISSEDLLDFVEMIKSPVEAATLIASGQNK